MTTSFVEPADSPSQLHIGIAAATWNQTITDKLLDGAISYLEEAGMGDVTVLRVPGALELPIAAQALIGNGCDAVVAIGTIVKGDTDHYEIVVRESTAGITKVAIETGKPVTNAILAVHDIQDAVDRSGLGADNKGIEAAAAAVSAALALRGLEQ